MIDRIRRGDLISLEKGIISKEVWSFRQLPLINLVIFSYKGFSIVGFNFI